MSRQSCEDARMLMSSMKEKHGNTTSEEGVTRRQWVDFLTECIFAVLPCTRANPDQMSRRIGPDSPFYFTLYHDCLQMFASELHAVFFRGMNAIVRNDDDIAGTGGQDDDDEEIALITVKGMCTQCIRTDI